MESPMLKTPLGRFRAVALAEGLSFVVLLFIAMPLKYALGLPLAVKYVGWAHGLLFVLYPVVGALAAVGAAVIVALALLIAFGPDGSSSTNGAAELHSLGFR